MSSVEQTPPVPPPATSDNDVRKLRRSRSNRWIAGVCGGLAEYFGLNAAVYRVLFIALAFAGGTGILLYLAAALVMPDENADESALTETLRRHRDRPWLVIGLALLALALIVFVFGGPGDGPGFVGPAFFLLLVVGGAVLLWSRAARRDARRRERTGRGSVAWRLTALVAVAALLAAAIGGAFTVAHAKGGIGQRHERPVSASELKDEYRLGMGQLELDLRDLELPRGETRVEAEVGFGELDIYLPADVPVAVIGEVGGGEADILGRRTDGRDANERFVDAQFDNAPTRLVVDASVGAGELDVRR